MVDVTPALHLVPILYPAHFQGRGNWGPGGAAAPPTLAPGGGQLPHPNFGAGGVPPQLLHVGTSGIGDGLPYKVFHNGCYKVNRNFAVRS